MDCSLIPLIVVVSAALTFLQIAVIIQRRSEARRMNKMTSLLYKEYKKIYGREWAEEAFKDMVKKIVERVDKGTTTVVRRAAV
jgi:hypothetical protein